MADEDKGLTSKEANSAIQKILTQLRRSQAETTKGQIDAIKTFEKNLDAVKGLSDEQTTRAKRAALLEQSLNYDKASAMEIAKTTEALESVRKRLGDIRTLGEETGQLDDAMYMEQIRSLQAQERQLEEQQKFGRSLGTLERWGKSGGFGIFNKMEKAINEGNLTFANIGSGLKDDLRGDFDKVLGFFGPVAGILQQIPFLGTIFNLLKRLTLKTLAYFLTAGKNFITSFKQRKKADKVSADFYKKQNKQNEKANRDKAKGVGASPAATAASGDPTDGQPQDDGEGGFVFQKASLFLVTAAAIGGPAGAALGGAAAGMTSFGKAAFAMGKALVIGGVALGIGLTGVFGAFALGEKMGAFDGMEAFGKVNMLKVLGSMLGLATLIGVLGLIMSSGVGALIMGVGALAVMGLVGVLVLMGKGLGNFAESIEPFESINVPRIKANIQQLSSITGDIREILNSAGGFRLSQVIGQHPLEDLAAAVNMYDQDMQASITNLENLKVALTDFKLPELPESEQGIGGWFMGLIGEDFVGELEDLSEISLTKELGDNLGYLGDGLDKIGKALGGITEAKVNHLERIQEAVSDMDSVTLNFNTNAPIPVNLSGAAANAMNGSTVMQVNQPVANNQVNNVGQKRFVASGSRMGHHSAMTYAGQLG